MYIILYKYVDMMFYASYVYGCVSRNTCEVHKKSIVRPKIKKGDNNEIHVNLRRT